MKITKKIVFFILCICLLFQTGCWDQKLFEDIGFILQMGLENDGDGKMLFSMTSPVVSADTSGKVEFLYTSSENMIRASRDKLRNVSGKMLQGGKIQIIYFSKELAKKGINEFFDIFVRDPQNPLLANIAIVDGSPKEMMQMSVEYKDKPRPAFYVTELLKDARERGSAPESRIYNFSILTYSKTIDPVVPLIRYDDKNIEIIGSALFSGEKMVGDIDLPQTILLNTLMGKVNNGVYTFSEPLLDDNSNATKKGTVLTLKKPKRKINIDLSGNKPIINIDLKLEALMDENSGAHQLDNEEIKSKIEEKVAKSIKDDTTKLFKHLQEVGSDPVGIGELVRAKHNQYFKSVQWKDIYKTAVINLDVKLNIEFYGTIK